MSRYYDDGSTKSGIITAVCVVLAFIAGYWIRDQGFKVRIDAPAIQRRAK